jgi:two-component system, NtrC family, sensor histidine kinase HydH
MTAPETPITTRTLHRERVKVAQHVAAGIAHELRNPVFAIASAAQLLRYRNNDDPIIERNLGRILRETERLNALVGALLEYGRPAPVQLAAADPDDVWTDVLTANRGILESKALLINHATPRDRASCGVDAEQLAQAFGNVLANAIDAAPEGSDLTIHSSVDRDGMWRSLLHNDGSPIPADVLPRVFEPLVTTKPGRAGIGLAVAHRIISEHGGAISIDSGDSAAGGTTVTFTLPAARL